MIHKTLTMELDLLRLRPFLDQFRHADASEGIGELYEDRPSSPVLGVFTVVFLKRFCEENPEYIWRKL